MRPWQTLVIWIVLLGAVACQWRPIKRVAPPHNLQYPADLAISIYVIGEPGAKDPLRRTSMFVLQPDRSLFAGRGLQVDSGYRPPLLGRITATQFESIVRIVRDHSLIAEPTSPGSAPEEHPSVAYEVDITAWGMINRYRTTPHESPPTTQLLAQLMAAATGDTIPSGD